MIRKSLTSLDFQAYNESVSKGLTAELLPKYPIKTDIVVKSAEDATVSIPPSMVPLEETNIPGKKVSLKIGEGDDEFVLKYKTDIVKYEDPFNPGKTLTMEVPHVDITDPKKLIDLMIHVTELYSVVREYGLSVLATYPTFTGPVEIKHTGPALAEKLMGIDGHAPFVYQQLEKAGKTQDDIDTAMATLDAEKTLAVIRNGVHYNAVKNFIAALKEIKEQLNKTSAATPTIHVADSQVEAVIHKTAAPEVRPISVGEPKKPTTNNADLIG